VFVEQSFSLSLHHNQPRAHKINAGNQHRTYTHITALHSITTVNGGNINNQAGSVWNDFALEVILTAAITEPLVPAEAVLLRNLQPFSPNPRDRSQRRL
jgi:hypothetical protein